MVATRASRATQLEAPVVFLTAKRMSRTSVALSVSTGHLRLFAIAHFGCVRHLTSVTMRNRIATLARRKCAKTVSLRGGDQWLAAWHGCAIQPHPFIRVHSTGASNQSNLSLLRVGNTRNALRACRVCGTVLGCECMISRILVSMFHRCRMSQPFSRAAGNGKLAFLPATSPFVRQSVESILGDFAS